MAIARPVGEPDGCKVGRDDVNSGRARSGMAEKISVGNGEVQGEGLAALPIGGAKISSSALENVATGGRDWACV